MTIPSVIRNENDDDEPDPSHPDRHSRKSIACDLPENATVPELELDEVFDKNISFRRQRYSTVNSTARSGDITLGPLERAIAALTEQQKKEQYEVCMNLFGGNKVTTKNAFTLHLIECLSEMAETTEGSTFDFQKVSLTLQASTKIYGARVDALHCDAINMLSDVNRNQPKDDLTDSNATTDQDEDNVKDKPKKSKKPKKVFVLENTETLSLPLEKIAISVPHYEYEGISHALDPNSQILGSMYVNDFDEFDNQVVLDRKIPVSCQQNTEDITPTNENKMSLIDKLAKGYFDNISGVKFRHYPLSFFDEKWPIVNDDFEFGESPTVDDVDDSAMSFHDTSFHDVQVDNEPGLDTDTDHHALDTTTCFPSSEIPMAQAPQHSRHLLTSDLFSDATGYECFNKELITAAANITCVREKGQLIINKHRSALTSHTVKRKPKKKKLVLYMSNEKDPKFIIGKRTRLSKRTASWMDEDRISLELKFDQDAFKEHLQGGRIKKVDINIEEENFDDIHEDSPSELNLSVNHLDEDHLEVDAPICVHDDEIVPSHDLKWAELFDDASLGLKKKEGALYTVRRINYKRLSSELAKILIGRKGAKTGEIGCGDTAHMDDKQFLGVVHELTKVFKDAFGKVSFVNSFVSLLHHASVNNLNLEQYDDLSDVKIIYPERK